MQQWKAFLTKTTEPILVGSEVWLELELESAFPVDLRFDDVAVSLTHGPLTSAPTVTSSATGTDGSSEKSRRKINRPVLHTFSGTGNAGPGIHRTPSNRSTSSVVSSAASSLIQVRLLMKPGMIFLKKICCHQTIWSLSLFDSLVSYSLMKF